VAEGRLGKHFNLYVLMAVLAILAAGVAGSLLADRRGGTTCLADEADVARRRQAIGGSHARHAERSAVWDPRRSRSWPFPGGSRNPDRD